MKAANLLLSDDGVLQIADFGLARSIEDPSDGRKRVSICQPIQCNSRLGSPFIYF